MKIGLVGYGYWGKIIYNNLIQLGFQPVVCDVFENEVVKYNDFKDLIKEDISHVFIVVPVENHFECVKFFLENKINVFCEKPLTSDIESTQQLYRISDTFGVKLFVDWIFTFNKSINYIKYLKDNLNLKPINIFMNRLNKGPVRYDTDSKFDLSSHDVSILMYLFSDYELNYKKLLDFKRNISSLTNDSSVIVLNFGTFTAQINSSWEYGFKERTCIFEFDRGVIEWDDNKRGLEVKFEIENLVSFNHFLDNTLVYDSPLKDSINSFLNNKDFDYKLQRKITIETIKILN